MLARSVSRISHGLKRKGGTLLFCLPVYPTPLLQIAQVASGFFAEKYDFPAQNPAVSLRQRRRETARTGSSSSRCTTS